MLKEDCGGNYSYLPNGIKDCSNCVLPHIKDVGYRHIMKKMDLVMEKAKKERD
jgi:Zn-finger protein